MEKELYLKAKKILIDNYDLQFSQLKNLMSDFIDSYNLNDYILDVIINTDYDIAGYHIGAKRILINFYNIKKSMQKELEYSQNEEDKTLIKISHYYDTMIHEMRHAKQLQMINQNDILFEKIHQDTMYNMDIYSFLHDYCPLEIDANFESTLEIDNLFNHTDNIDNKISNIKASNYILQNLLALYYEEEGIIIPAEVFYNFLDDRSFMDLIETLNLSLEQRLRLGLKLSNDEIRNIITGKEDGKTLKQLLLTR